MLFLPGYLRVSNILKVILNSGFYKIAFAILPCFGMLEKKPQTHLFKQGKFSY